MKRNIFIALLLIFAIPLLAMGEFQNHTTFTLGGISTLLLGIFLYLLHDYTSSGTVEESPEAFEEMQDFAEPFRRGLLKNSIFQSVKDFFTANPLLEDAEIYFAPDNGQGLKINKNGSVFAITSTLQSLPEAVMDSIHQQLIVRLENDIYLPLGINGIFSYIHFQGSYPETDIALFWDHALRLTVAIKNGMIETLNHICPETGLKKQEKLEQDLPGYFSSSRVKYLTLIQIHSDHSGFLQTVQFLREKFPEMYLAGGHTVAFFQTEKEQQKMASALGDIFRQKNLLDSEITLSIGSSPKKSSSGNWFSGASRALRQACIMGPDYYYQESLTEAVRDYGSVT